MHRYVITYKGETVFNSRSYSNRNAAITAGAFLLLKVKEEVSKQLTGIDRRYDISFEVFPC